MVVASGLICVFAKPPVPGQVKTRLAARLGDASAAALAGAFLADTWQLATSFIWARAILATTDATWGDRELLGQAEIWLQGEGDLGERMERIARAALARAEYVILIGADSPGLPPRLLEQARSALTQVDAVLGPSDDGGFYLLGLRRCPDGLLRELPWSAPTTLAATRARLEACGLWTGTTDGWFDVDLPEDLERLQSYLDQDLVRAPHTANVLLSLSSGAPGGST